MHYGNLVILEKPEGFPNPHNGMNRWLEAAVSEAMGPSEDDGGFWDWYQIGGRWTGLFDGYDPEKDPANIVVCDLCHGTGRRDDELGKSLRTKNPEYTCNGCSGEGKRAEWPTQWKFHPGDLMPIENLTQEHLNRIYRVVLNGASWGGEEYIPWKSGTDNAFYKREMPPLEWLKKEYEGYLVVIVDNHS